ncbi:TPA: hypothetical protein IAD41_02120 [Candidatus Scatenecus faecavium]|uniref:DUF6613 domain-containing protein n=1 Tax=Candidatus Scatenecus faecavium TaxID=2840915 RepID=A0A9D1K4I2_9BACT|nr:hypothetical protein [Candidatus Scatenecus faecavium]
MSVIGIVAAMTLPALINKYDRTVTETRLAKFYSTFNQAILRSLEVNGPYEGWSFFVELEPDDEGNIDQTPINNAFDQYLRPFMNIVNVKEDDCLSKQTDKCKCNYYILADGSAFTFSEHLNRTIWFYPKADWQKCVKSYEAPNGICRFVFSFQPLFKTKDWTYHSNKGLEPFLYKWDGTEEMLLNHTSYGCALSEGEGMPHLSGAYCTALIQRNGWKIPKNYPRRIKY